MARTARTPQASKRDRFSTKVADRIAMRQVNKALEAAEDAEARHGRWLTVGGGQPTTYGFDAVLIG